MKTRFLEWCKTKLGWRAIQAFLVILMNTTFIVFFAFKGVNFNIGDGVEITMWEAMTNKTLHILLSTQGIELPYDYHWYNDWIIYFFMIVGALISLGFIKFLYKKSVEDRRAFANVEKNNVKEPMIDKIEKRKMKIDKRLLKETKRLWKD